MVAEVEHAAEIKTALDVALVGATKTWHAYDYDDVPDPLPNLYALITVSKRYGAPTYFCGGKASTGYRLTTLAVGRTTDEARWVRDRIAAAIEDQALTVDGEETTRLRLESEQPVELDDGRYSGTTAWTYALSR